LQANFVLAACHLEIIGTNLMQEAACDCLFFILVSKVLEREGQQPAVIRLILEICFFFVGGE